MNDDRLLTMNEVAEKLQMSRSAVYTLLANGTVPSLKIGRCRRVRAASLAMAMERLEAAQRD